MLLRNLTLKVEDTDLSSGETGFALDQRLLVGTLQAAIDLGGGPLGSAGNNCLAGNTRYDAETTGFAVPLEHNWWGNNAGPADGKTSASPVIGSLDVEPWLTSPPPICGG